MTVDRAAAPDFPVVACARCGRDALCYADLDGDDREILRCVGCESIVDDAVVRWLDLHELEALGFGEVIPEGGCGRPDCGKGRCGRAEPDAI